jgi:hypothetical protein
MILKSIPCALAFCLALAVPRADELQYNSADTAAATAPARVAVPKSGLEAKILDGAAAELDRASTLTSVGHAMAAGGMILGFLGNSTQSAPLAVVGNIMSTIGLPMVGIGAGRVNRAAETLNPDYRANYRGWGWYWTGFGMGAAGFLMLNNIVNEANAAETEEEQEKALEGVGFPILLLLGSSVCTITSWVKFGKLAGEGQRAGREAASMRDHGRLEIAPTLAILSDGKAAPGLHLGYRF